MKILLSNVQVVYTHTNYDMAETRLSLLIEGTIMTVELKNLTCEEIGKLDRRLPVILPIGIVEAHGPHLSVSVDIDTAEYFARAVTDETGAILAPCFNYGFADEMREYAGTFGLRPHTLSAAIGDLLESFCSHGFDRIILMSGHGANKMPCEMAFWKVWETYPDAKLAYWNWWTEAGIRGIHHADEGETQVAAVVGSKYYPERARDFKINKPWYKLRSRHKINPESGGINGAPTKTDLAKGEENRKEVISVLSERVRKIIDEGHNLPNEE